MITTRSSRGWIFIFGLALVPADIAASTTERGGNRNNCKELALSARECQHGGQNKRVGPGVKLPRTPAGRPGARPGTRPTGGRFSRLTWLRYAQTLRWRRPAPSLSRLRPPPQLAAQAHSTPWPRAAVRSRRQHADGPGSSTLRG